VAEKLNAREDKGSIEIALQDYRDETALYDNVISCEMIEAVGKEYLACYFKKIKDVLNNAPGCYVIDKRENGGYATPIEATGKNETFISRIREDKTKKNSLNLWIVSDNLLRGAALNSVEIAEAIINNN